MNKVIKNLVFYVFLLIILSVISIIIILWTYSNELPDYKFLKNYKPPVSSKLYSGEGELVIDFATEKRIFIPYNSIPKIVINSFLSAEDKNFFDHPGVDAKGVLRAVYNNIYNILGSKRLEGASTITQQVAKNFLLTNEVSLDRKLKEAILAFRIERAFSKERILELYLNQIYLGEGSYGIASASLKYFDKPISNLSYSEAALLAALPKAPSKYNPYKNLELSKFRRNLVLKNLYDNGYINENNFKKFAKSEIKLSKRERIFLEDSRYFVEDVRKTIVELYGFNKVYKQGFSIKTPLNLNLQKIATDSLRDGLLEYDKRKGWRGPLFNSNEIKENWRSVLKKYKLEKSLEWEIAIVKKIEKFSVSIVTENNKSGIIRYENINWTKKDFDKILKVNDVIYVKRINKNIYSLQQLPEVNGGIVAMDPFTGRVFAISGGFSFLKSEFNRATQASRQPGSALKPFIYALALESQFKPNTLILDAPIVLEQGEDLKMWKPENYGKKFYGLSTLRTGIEKSRNLMTVRISQKLGLDAITDFTKKLNIYEDPKKLMSISLGSEETTLLKLTTAYSSFINGGKLINPILIDRIQDSEGKTIFNNEKRYCENCDLISYDGVSNPIIKNKYQQIFSPQTAYQITSMLKGVIERGTGKGLKELKLELAGKTGTTNKNTDTWFIGFTSNLVVGVYIGYDSPRSLGKFETGSKTAMPVFKEFMKSTANSHNARPFKVADNINMMVIDAKTGKKANPKTKLAIIESFKKNNNKLDSLYNKFDSRLNTSNILKFY